MQQAVKTNLKLTGSITAPHSRTAKVKPTATKLKTQLGHADLLFIHFPVKINPLWFPVVLMR